jgi:hypothetical protein
MGDFASIVFRQTRTQVVGNGNVKMFGVVIFETYFTGDWLASAPDVIEARLCPPGCGEAAFAR